MRIESINEAIFPHRVSGAVNQMLSVKLHELRKEYHDARNAIHDERPKMLAVVELPLADQELIRQVEDVLAARRVLDNQYSELTKQLARYAPGMISSAPTTHIRLQETPEEQRRRDADKQTRVNALRLVFESKVEALVEVAKKIAALSITATRVKVPADLLAELDAIGKAAPDER